MSTCASNWALTSSGAFAEGCSARAVSGTKTGESSCGALPGGSGRVLVGGTVGSVVVGRTVVVLAIVVTAAGMVVATVVEGRLVSGEVVSTVGCVSGGGGGMVVGTVEEEVEVEDVVVVSTTVEVVEEVDVELVCSTVLVVVDSSVDVVVGADDEPTHERESKSHRSQSAGTENETIDLPAGAITCTMASQHEPSIGCWIVVSSSRTAVRLTVPFLAPATNWNPCTATFCGNTKVVGALVLNRQIDGPLVP